MTKIMRRHTISNKDKPNVHWKPAKQKSSKEFSWKIQTPAMEVMDLTS